MHVEQPLPHPCAHGRIFREPKGGPDVTLAGSEAQLDVLVRAANTLSVQGWTARIVLLNVPSMQALPPAERDALLGSGPLISILENGAPDAGALAAAALREIRG